MRGLRRAACAALCILVLVSVGEASAHGLRHKPEFIKGDRLAFDIDLPIGPKQSKCLCGLVHLFFCNKPISCAHQDQKIATECGGVLGSIEPCGVAIEGKCAAHSFIAEQGAAIQGETRSKIGEAAAHRTEFGGRICAGNRLTLSDAVFERVRGPNTEHERQYGGGHIDAKGRVAAGVFEFVLNGNVPTFSSVPTLIIVCQGADEADINSNPRSIGVIRLSSLRFFAGNDILDLEAARDHQRNYTSNYCPQGYNFVSVPPPDRCADTDQERRNDKQPNNSDFHRFSLHDVPITALVLFCCGLVLGGLGGALLVLKSRREISSKATPSSSIAATGQKVRCRKRPPPQLVRDRGFRFGEAVLFEPLG